MKLSLGIILLLLVFLFPLFNSGIYISHDGENHIARFAAYYQSFIDGQFPPRWAGNLNFGYGTPVLIFFYPLPGYLASMIHFLGLSFQDAFKFLMISSFILAPIAFYLWTKLLFKKEVAVLGGILYGLMPYHFLNLYVRGDIGEMLGYAFLPLVFWGIEKTLQVKNLRYLLLGGLFYGALILSHNGVSLMFSPILLLYGMVRSSNKKVFLHIVALLGIGLLISAFFWIPALYEGKYVNAKLFIGNMYKDHFPTFFQLIDPRWEFGSDAQKKDGLSPQIGLLSIFFVAISFLQWFRDKKQRKMIAMWMGIFIVGLFLILSISDVVWKNISILRLYQFPWRFVGLASFASCILACYVMSAIKNKKLLIFLFSLIIIISLPFVKVKGYFYKNDNYYKSFTGTTYYQGEASPIWTAGDPGFAAKRQIEIIGGKGSVKNFVKKTQIHTFTVNVENVVTFVDNTLYYPGWKVFVDGQNVPIQFQDPNHRGLITFQVPKGIHQVKVTFTETNMRKLANLLSLTSIGVILIFFTITLLYNKRIKWL